MGALLRFVQDDTSMCRGNVDLFYLRGGRSIGRSPLFFRTFYVVAKNLLSFHLKGQNHETDLHYPRSVS